MMISLALSLALQAGGKARDLEGPEEFEVLRTKTAIPLAQGVWELDAFVFMYSFDDFRDSGVDVDFLGLQVEGTYGITEWLTAEVEIPCLRVDPDPGDTESGIGDIRLEGKFSFNRHRRSPAGLLDLDVAGGARVTLPTGDEDEGLGQEHAVFGLFAAGSHRFSPIVAAHAEIFLDLQKEHRPEHGINVAADFTPWGREWSLLAGLNMRREGTERTEVDLVPGAEYRFSPQVSAGAGLPIGLTNDSPDWGLLVDAQVRF